MMNWIAENLLIIVLPLVGLVILISPVLVIDLVQRRKKKARERAP